MRECENIICIDHTYNTHHIKYIYFKTVEFGSVAHSLVEGIVSQGLQARGATIDFNFSERGGKIRRVVQRQRQKERGEVLGSFVEQFRFHFPLLQRREHHHIHTIEMALASRVGS